MGNPRKPLAERTASGAIIKNPKRHRAYDQQSFESPLGEPSNYLSEDELVVWSELTRASLFSEAQRPLLELAAMLWAKVRRREADNADAAQLRLCLHALGIKALAPKAARPASTWSGARLPSWAGKHRDDLTVEERRQLTIDKLQIGEPLVRNGLLFPAGFDDLLDE